METQIPDILVFLHRASWLKNIVRFKSSLSQNRDSAADHSWRVALMALVIGKELEMGVDVSRSVQIALVHDLAESRTDDIDAYDVITNRVALETKNENELVAMRAIVDGVSCGEMIMSLWREYEAQQTLEAKYVKALDKIEGFLHLDEMGTGAYVPQQFHGDYADTAVRSFDEVAQQFPPLRSILDPIKIDLKRKFEERGIEWVEQGMK